MRLLLDTHALIWWLTGSTFLSRSAREEIDSAQEVFVSGVSALEVTTKVRIGKWDEAAPLARRLQEAIEGEGFLPLAFSVRHGQLAGNMDFPNKDPFDRSLVAQAILENLTLVSNEKLFDGTGVSRIW